MYDWIYENHVNTLHQIAHVHFDFTSPTGQAVKSLDEKKNM